MTQYTVEGKRVPELQILSSPSPNTWLPIYDPSVDITKRVSLQTLINYVNINTGNFTEQDVRDTDLLGLSIVNSIITSTDTVLSAFGKLQGQINSISLGTPTLAQVLLSSSLTNEIPIVSNNGSSGLYINDGYLTLLRLDPTHSYNQTRLEISDSGNFGDSLLAWRFKTTDTTTYESYISSGTSQSKLYYSNFIDSGFVAIGSTLTNIQHTIKIKLDAPLINTPQLTASTVPIINSSNNLISSTVSLVELDNLLYSTGNIQSQIDAITGAGYIITISGITAGGELEGTYANPTLANSAVIGKILTGLNVIGSTIVDTDTILEAFGKTQNQINGLLGGAIYQGIWNATTNTPALVSSIGTKGYYYVVSVAGSTNLNGTTDWKIGDWVIFNGTIWEKVDNTDAVSSVNGYIGAVSLVTSDISENTNLYFTNARAIASTLTAYTSGAGIISSSDTILQAIQKLNGNIELKSNIASPTFTGTLTTPAIVVSSETASTIASFDASKNIKSLSTATYPSLTELSYVKGLPSAIQPYIQNSTDKYVVASGTDTYTVTLSPVPTAYTTGQTFWVKIPNANTITNPTLNVNSLGAKTIKKSNSEVVPVGTFKTNGNYCFIYDGTDFIIQGGIIDSRDIKLANYINTDSTAVTGTTAETYLTGILVPQLYTNSVLRIRFRNTKTGTAGATVPRLYYNTTNDMAGTPVQIGLGVGAAASLYQYFERTIVYKNSLSLCSIFRTTVAVSDDRANNGRAMNNPNIDLSGKYLVVAVTPANNADSIVCESIQLEHLRP